MNIYAIPAGFTALLLYLSIIPTEVISKNPSAGESVELHVEKS